MTDSIDFSEVPYIQDLLNYLPISPTDDGNILTYIQNVTSTITINFNNGQYQFAYFGLHLLFMTYLYCTVWKISKLIPIRYSDAVVFAKTYNNRNNEIDIENINSVFEYSLLPEKEVSKVFKLINLDKSQISNVTGLVSLRDEMAHATGKFKILTEDHFLEKANSVLSSINNIHTKMELHIRNWYKNILLTYCENGFPEYDCIQDIINEQMIENFKLSMNELDICNRMSLRHLITENRSHESELKKFKFELRKLLSNYHNHDI